MSKRELKGLLDDVTDQSNPFMSTVRDQLARSAADDKNTSRSSSPRVSTRASTAASIPASMSSQSAPTSTRSSRSSSPLLATDQRAQPAPMPQTSSSTSTPSASFSTVPTPAVTRYPLSQARSNTSAMAPISNPQPAAVKS